MSTSITPLLESLWNGRHGDSLDDTLKVYDKLNTLITENHIEELKAFVNKNGIGFWLSELITVTVLETGGSNLLPFGLEVLYRHSLEDHDSDALATTLIGTVEAEPEQSKVILEEISNSGAQHLHEDALWLLDFC
ncbi:hypothetical protein [Rubritalea tangerina]|uniref:Immunity protein 30 domain-containing protein n=1 Tax=Rubritalea tangerina TaxID=430798 RepID=A0ABW4Z7X7_9BACT